MFCLALLYLLLVYQLFSFIINYTHPFYLYFPLNLKKETPCGEKKDDTLLFIEKLRQNNTHYTMYNVKYTNCYNIYIHPFVLSIVLQGNLKSEATSN